MYNDITNNNRLRTSSPFLKAICHIIWFYFGGFLQCWSTNWILSKQLIILFRLETSWKWKDSIAPLMLCLWCKKMLRKHFFGLALQESFITNTNKLYDSAKRLVIFFFQCLITNPFRQKTMSFWRISRSGDFFEI